MKTWFNREQSISCYLLYSQKVVYFESYTNLPLFGIFLSSQKSVVSVGVTLYGGAKASALFKIGKAVDLHHEYNALACTVEVVEDVYAAIDHIHLYGRLVFLITILLCLILNEEHQLVLT